MKNILKFNQIILIVLLGLFLTNCAEQEVVKKQKTVIPKEFTDCCPDGAGILDERFHYDETNGTDSTREGAPYIVYDVNGKDILYFSSMRKLKDHKNVTRMGDIFYSERDVKLRDNCLNKNWSEPKLIKTGDSDFDSWTKGAITIFGNKAIISSERSLNHQSPINTLGTSYQLDLWELDFSNGVFSNPKSLPENVNSPFWDSYPAFSQDGKTLYFVSNRPLPGETEPSDFNIWFTTKSGDNWSNAQPLSSINTEANEVTPLCSNDGKFFFSSDKTGNYDIYYTLPNSSTPINFNEYNNIKKPLNTAANETSAFISPECSSVFYASDRVGGKRDYDLFSCQLPNPTITLLINVNESMNICGTVERKPYKGFKLCLNDGKESKTFLSGTKIDLLPNKSYSVTLCDESMKQCFNTNISSLKTIKINTQSVCAGDMAFIDSLDIESTPITDNFSVGADNFVVGYWKPSTTSNINELNKRAKSGFFENPNMMAHFVRISELPSNQKQSDVDKIFKDITGRIESYIEKYNYCIKNDIYKLRINVKGFTDRQGITKGNFYCDETFTNPYRNWTIKQGTSMNDLQRGNIVLSKLRAYHTMTMLENMMESNPKYQELKGKIIFDFEGMGVDFNTYKGTNKKDDCPEARKMEVTIDLGPDCFLDKNVRIPQHVSYLPLSDKDDKDIASTNTSVIHWYDSKDFPKKDCDEFFSEYTFKSKENAEFVLEILKKFSDVDFSVESTTNSKDEEIFKLKSKTFDGSKSDAVKEMNASIEAISNAVDILKKSNPKLVAEGCQKYIISFGMFYDYEVAKDFSKKLDELEISDLKIKECNDCAFSKNPETKENDPIKTYIVLADGFLNYESADKQKSKWAILLNKYVIRNYMRVEKEEYK
jgi:hypothetical protein